MTAPSDRPLRSAQWYAGDDRNAYIHRAWMRRGLPADAFDGRPHIAIANTASDLTPCNAHLGEVARSVTRRSSTRRAASRSSCRWCRSARRRCGRPRCSGATWRRWRSRRCCAPTRSTASCCSAAATRRSRRCSWRRRRSTCPPWSCPAGRCSPARSAASPLGCGTDVWRLSEEVRAGTLSRGGLPAVGVVDDPQPRATATRWARRRRWALLAEALGMTLPGIAGTPAPDSRLLEAAHATGRLAVAAGRRRPPAESAFLTRGVVPQRDRRARRDRRVDERRRAPARHRRAARRRPDARRLRPHRRRACRCSSTCSPRAASSWTTCTARAACSPCSREVRDLLDPDGAHRHRASRSCRYLDDARVWDAEVIRPRADAARRRRRHRRAARQPRARRRDHQARRRVAAPAAAPRPRAWCSTAIEDFHARIDDPDLDVDADTRAGAARLRPARLPGHARGGQHAAADQAARAGRARHGARLRRPDERHGVRHGRAARRPRGRGGRPARADPHRRRDRARRRRATPRRRRAATTSSPRASRPRPRPRRTPTPARGWERLYVDHVLQADTGADLDFLRRQQRLDASAASRTDTKRRTTAAPRIAPRGRRSSLQGQRRTFSTAHS